jgi:NADPH-dependent curcumin reductase CurA
MDEKLAPISSYVIILGVIGLMAYFGLTDIGKPMSGETVVVAGAAGAVGMAVGQIVKIYECRVIGVAGRDEKIRLLKGDLVRCCY